MRTYDSEHFESHEVEDGNTEEKKGENNEEEKGVGNLHSGENDQQYQEQKRH